MFSTKFDNIISKHPESADALGRIAAYFSRAEERGERPIEKMKLESRRLQEIAHISNTVGLSHMIALLVAEQVLRRVVVIESPIGGGIAEFGSVSEVPERVLDNRQDVMIDVTPDRLKTFYVPIL